MVYPSTLGLLARDKRSLFFAQKTIEEQNIMNFIKNKPFPTILKITATLTIITLFILDPFITPNSVAEAIRNEPSSLNKYGNQTLTTQKHELDTANIVLTPITAIVPAQILQAEAEAKKAAEEAEAKKKEEELKATEAAKQPTPLNIPPAGTPNPGSSQEYAKTVLPSYGWSEETEFSCLAALWERESNWNEYAHNTSSGAYGIPQSLPGSKMASAGADWQTNPHTQINWGLGYIQSRYGSPCAAWAHSEAVGWY